MCKKLVKFVSIANVTSFNYTWERGMLMYKLIKITENMNSSGRNKTNQQFV